MSLRDRIIAAKDCRSEVVDVPEWDGVRIEVREVDGLTRAQLAATANNESDAERIVRVYPILLGASLYDPETGERLFTTTEQVEELMRKSGHVLDRLALVALRLSGMTDGSVDEAGRSLPQT